MTGRIRGGKLLAPGFALAGFAALLSVAAGGRLVPDDPLFGEQWHLQNTGQSGGTLGEDIQVVNVWNTRLGTGIVLCVIDDGVEGNHPDLLENYSAALSTDINGGDADPSPGAAADSHGTQVAGSAAARNNAVGVCGSAPQATLAAIRLTAAATTAAQDAEAMSHLNASIHVKNNSWGPADGTGLLAAAEPLFYEAIRNGVTQGRNGLGVVYVWAAGNGGATGPDDANYDGYANNPDVIAVAATDPTGKQASFSEPGACILVAAPGVDILTTDRTGADGDNTEASPDGDYAVTQGTSFAAPITAGVVALLLQAYPNLTYRDVMWILVNTADTNDLTDSGWATNGSGRTVSHKYGHGRINAQAAVAAGATWTNVGPRSEATATASPAAPIPDNAAGGVTSTISIADAITAEHVEVEFKATHPSRGDLVVTLTSPRGTVSRLATPRTQDTTADYDWTFMTTLSWGESGAGMWTLGVEDLATGSTGTLDSWTLRVFGIRAISTSPSGLSFSTLSSGGPQSQTVTMTNSLSTAVGGTIVSNQSWCTVSPPSMTLAAGQSGTVTVTVNPAGVSPGSHTATVTFTDAADPTRRATVGVSLSVLSVLDEDDGGGGRGCDAPPRGRREAGLPLLPAAILLGLWLASRARARG